MLPPISLVLLRYGHQPCRDFKLLTFYKNCGETTDAAKKKNRGGGSNFIEFQRLSDRTMALIITAGSRDGKNYTDCNSLCTSHPGRLPRAAPSFAFSLSQPINYSLLTLESKLKQPAAHHQNRRSGRRDAGVLQLQQVQVRSCTGVHVYVHTLRHSTRALTGNGLFVLRQLSAGVNSAATTTSLFAGLSGEVKKADLTEHLNPRDTEPD